MARQCCQSHHSLASLADPHLEYTFLPMWPFQLDDEKAIVQLGLADLDALGEREAPFEMPRGDAAVKIVLRTLVALGAADREFVVRDADVELVASEAGDGQGDAQHFRAALAFGQKLDVIGRVPAIRAARRCIEAPGRQA